MDKKDIEKLRNLRTFEKSDASLKFIQTILLIATVLASGAAVILGFVLIGEYSGGALGWLLLLGGPALFIFLYFVSMFTLWTIYDIKMIRNALYDIEPSASLKSFAGNGNGMNSSSWESSSSSTGATQKPFYGAEPTSQSQALSSEDTMKKYEEWLANGTITKEEFEALKRKNGN